MKEYLIESTI